jgi:glucokinase
MTAAGAVIAVDVGGTTIKGAVVDADGNFLQRVSHATAAERGVDAVIAELLAVIAELRGSGAEIRAVGAVVPGAVDAAAGVAEYSTNLGFCSHALRAEIERATGLPALLDHDVHAAGVAERAVGCTVGVDDYVQAVIGTGIAAVIHAGGQSVRGAIRIAGELGHIPVWPDGDLCPCGQRGCLERYASAAAITRRYVELGGSDAASPAEIAALRASDPLARRVWDDAAQALGIAFATCTLLLDPALIVLGGGLSEAGEALREPVAAVLEERVLWRPRPPVVLSRLGGRAGLVGAAVLTWRLLGLERFDGWSPDSNLAA